MNIEIHLHIAPHDLNTIMDHSYAAIDRQVRVTAPKWLRRAGRPDLAFELESLRRIVDWESWTECWSTLAEVQSAIGESDSPPDKAELWADGWTIDNCNGRWAAQESHWRQRGSIVATGGVDDTFDGPLVDEDSSSALANAYTIIKAAAWQAQVAA